MQTSEVIYKSYEGARQLLRHYTEWGYDSLNPALEETVQALEECVERIKQAYLSQVDRELAAKYALTRKTKV